MFRNRKPEFLWISDSTVILLHRGAKTIVMGLSPGYFPKISMSKPPQVLSKSGFKDYFWTVPKAVLHEKGSEFRKHRKTDVDPSY